MRKNRSSGSQTDLKIQLRNVWILWLAALLSGYIDYFLMGDDGLEHLLSESDQLDYVEEPMEKLEVGAMFPQAALRQLPVYRGEIISLLKNTSIVGYIAIQDLTKMSDIIRSRTYEAFFPLIVTAVIYFILAWVISLLLRLVLKQIDPRGRKRTVKGVICLHFSAYYAIIEDASIKFITKGEPHGILNGSRTASGSLAHMVHPQARPH